METAGSFRGELRRSRGSAPERCETRAVRYLSVSEEKSGYSARLAEAPDPHPQADEVLIRVAASGLNRADLLQVAGRYPPPPGEPDILGLEVSGEIVGTGEKVCALLAGGGHAELVAAPRGQVFPVPRSCALVDAAAIPEAWLTAFLNLVVEASLPRGGALLVHAGGSGVGLAAIALGKFLGARVAATTRTREKLPALERAGAELALDVSGRGFEAEIEARWGSGAVDVVLDPVGATTLGGDLRVLAVGGRIVSIAAMSGSQAELDLSALHLRRARLIGSTLRSRSRPEKAEIVRRFVGEALAGFETGALAPAVDSIFPAERAAEAFDRMRHNRNTGKILIDWTGHAARVAVS